MCCVRECVRDLCVCVRAHRVCVCVCVQSKSESVARAEIAVLQAVGRHPNIAALVDSFEDDSHFYLIMELYVTSHTLTHPLAQTHMYVCVCMYVSMIVCMFEPTNASAV